MPDRVNLPDGTYVDIPDDASREYRIEMQKQIDKEFGTNYAQDMYQGYGASGIQQLTKDSATSQLPQGDGTLLGSAWEGIKSIPRGLEQFSIMAQQGFEGLRTPDEDTDREKELRQRMDDLMMEIDPRYRDSNLVHVGMGLGQVAGMIGLGAGAGFLGAGTLGATAVAGTATALMGAGEQSSRIAEFEEATGQDVSAAKEKLAMGMGLGIGLSEVALGPMAKFGKALGVARKSGAPLKQVLADSAENVVEGGLMKSVLRQSAEEALQEGSAGFAQSATARALYDEDALIGAGPAALKEALIGGQVGGTVEVLSKMLARSISGTGKMNRQVARIVNKKRRKLIEEGKLSTADIDDLYTDLDVDDSAEGERNRLMRDRIVELDEATGEYMLREDEGSMVLNNKNAFTKRNEELWDAYENGEITFEDYKKATDQIIDGTNNLNRELEILVAGYNAQAKGRLGTGPVEAVEAVPVQSETVPVENITIENHVEPQLSEMGEAVTVSAADLQGNMEAVLQKSPEDIEVEVREETQEKINEQKRIEKQDRYELELKERDIRRQQKLVDEQAGLEQKQQDKILEISPPLRYEVGEQVIHPEFGEGAIEQVQGTPQDIMVEKKHTKGPKKGQPVVINNRTQMQNRLVDTQVSHETFGNGRVTGVKGENITVKFGKDKPRTIKADFLANTETGAPIADEIEAQKADKLVVKFGDESRVVSSAPIGQLTTMKMENRAEELRGRTAASIIGAKALVTRARNALEKTGQATVDVRARQDELHRKERREKYLARTIKEGREWKLGEGMRDYSSTELKNLRDELKEVRKQLPALRKESEALVKVEEKQEKLRGAEQELIKRQRELAGIEQDLSRGASASTISAVPVVGKKLAQTDERVAVHVSRIDRIENGPWRGKETEDKLIKIENERTTLEEENRTLTSGLLFMLGEGLSLQGLVQQFGPDWHKPEFLKQFQDQLPSHNDEQLKLLKDSNKKLISNQKKISKLNEQGARLSAQDSRGLVELQQDMGELGFTAKQQAKTTNSVNITPSTKLNEKGQELAQALGLDEATMLERIAQFREANKRRKALLKEVKVLETEIGKLDPSVELRKLQGERQVLQERLANTLNKNIFPDIDIDTTLQSLDAAERVQDDVAIEESKKSIKEQAIRKETARRSKKERKLGVGELEQRLATQKQRDALRGLMELVADPETGDVLLKPAQVRKMVQDILAGGVLVRQTTLDGTTDVEPGPKKRLPATKQEAEQEEVLVTEKQRTKSAEKRIKAVQNRWLYGSKGGRVEGSILAGVEAADKVFHHTLGIGSLVKIADGLEDSGAYDRPKPKKWVGLSFGILGKKKFIDFRKKLEKAGYEIEPEHILEVLKLKNFKPFKNEANFKNSPFFQQLIVDTVVDLGAVETGVSLSPEQAMRLKSEYNWNTLTEGEKQAVLARVLNTPQQPETIAATAADDTTRAERIEFNVDRLQNGQMGPLKTYEQLFDEAQGIEEARERFEIFKAKVIARFKKLGITAIPTFLADVDSAFAQIQDVIANGAFEYEMDPDTGKPMLDDRGTPIVKKDRDGKPIYRPGYERGAVASLNDYGNRIMFNLSQIVERYSDDETGPWHTKMDEIVRDMAVHEGTHIHFHRNLLNQTEHKTLETFGKKEGYVPASVSKTAHEKKLTWREFIKQKYAAEGKVLTEAQLTEETSVHILDALAKGQLAPNKTAGLIGKIKRTQTGIFASIFQSAAEADIAPVLQVFERIQNVDLMKQRAEKRALGKGMESLRFVERADPKDIRALKKAIKDNDVDAQEEIAERILLKKQEFAETDTRTDMERLQESLMSELRARREIDGNPSYAYGPLLNSEAIEAGEIDIESLNAYFRFRDGREPPFVVPTGKMDLLKFRSGDSTLALGDDTTSFLDTTEPGGAYVDTGVAPAEANIKALEDYNKYHTDEGNEEFVKTQEEFEGMMAMSALERLNMRIFDQRLPMWKAQARDAKRRAEAGEYESSLKMLSDQLAISAWRWADNATNYVSMIINTAPLQYINGGFDINKEAVGRDGETPVKAFADIEAPLLEIERGEELASRYLNSLRVADVHKMMEKARLDLASALASNNVERIAQERKNLEEWSALYERANPFTENKDTDGNLIRLIPDKTVTDANGNTIAGWKETVTFFEEGTGEEHAIVRKFASEWADLNAHMLQLAVDTGQMDQARADIMKEMAYVPFYRDQGWNNDTDFTNPNNKHMEESNREAANDDPVLRGANLLDKAIQGSVAPINTNLFAMLRKNMSAIVRDSMRNVASTRTMRDMSADGTSVRLVKPSLQDKLRLKYLTERKKHWQKQRKKDPEKADNELLYIEKELTPLAEKINEEEKAYQEQKKKLDDAGFSDIEIMVKGVATPASMVTDAEGNLVHQPGEMTENGVTVIYRTIDPVLARAIMDIGFSPMQAIEDFFGKTLGAGDANFPGTNIPIAKGMAKLLVGSSRLLREAVTRSPPFMLKNIMRDSMQASVVYGGFPEIYFRVFRNLANYKTIVQEAENRGLGIAVDQAFDEPDASTSVRASWDSQIPIFGSLWNTLGHMSRVSEVATRMAVYDMAMKDTGNAAEAQTQATEIMNYGRRGSSRLFATIAAMAPFMNGRMQGLSVLTRNHFGRLDSPGLFMKDGQPFPPEVEKRMRVQQAIMRGGLITLATLGYFLMMKDDEEYKNAREDMKNDWWLIPLGKDENGKARLGFKIPIPFEVGLIYKVIPEQILRVMTEEEHDLGDMTSEMRRQLKSSLMFDIRPQLIRPMLDAMSNRDAFQRDSIIPSWMDSSVAASQQYNPYTNMVARLIGDKLDNVPLVSNLDFLTSPMKLEYMLRQYTGTLGAYVMAAGDRVAREVMNENIAGTSADFGFSMDTFAQMPMLGDLFFNPAKGGGYQEDFYETVEYLDGLITTMGQIRKSEGTRAAEEFKLEHEDMFVHKGQLQHFDRRMKKYREQRDALFQRSDISKERKRAMLHRMFEQRDDMLADMLRIMSEIKRDRSVAEQVLEKGP